MEHIILQIMIELFEKFLEYYETHGIPGLHKTLEDFKQMSDEMVKDVVNTFIASADEAIRNAREERMGDRIKIRQSRVPRELFTVVGPFKYERTYFDTPKGRSYILDDLLGVESYERIDAGVSAELVNAAASNSYGKSADIITEGRVSRQSVRNKVMNTGEVVYVPPIAEKTPEILHIFADEDHVHLKNGKSTILPLITVCEGKRLVSKGRNELIRPFHLHGYGMKAEEFWEYTYALCEQRYDMTQVKENLPLWRWRCMDQERL